MKFLKRERKESLDELDLPPAPPPLEGFDENLPELPEFPKFDEEKISATEEMPKFDFPEEEKLPELGEDDTIPDFQTFAEMEEKSITPIPPIRIPPTQPMPSIPEPMLTITRPVAETEQESVAEEQPNYAPEDAYPRIRGRLFAQEKRSLRERTSVKTIYVRIDKFKATLGSINLVRSDLRKAEEASIKLENIKSAKDKSFDKVRYLLDDLQKKLIFVDKTLFKGDGN
ncbi:hypothetical protein HYX00_02180 [Candidatus Woesearchaeota archaeon]|nr:hypothetical protein [Candidatus Woesearchaeota archaeon]